MIVLTIRKPYRCSLFYFDSENTNYEYVIGVFLERKRIQRREVVILVLGVTIGEGWGIVILRGGEGERNFGTCIVYSSCAKVNQITFILALKIPDFIFLQFPTQTERIMRFQVVY